MAYKNKEDKAAYDKKYYLKNKEKNRERKAEYLKKYRLDNKDKRAEYDKQWCLDNPEKKRSLSAKRRAAKLQRTVGWSDKLVIDMIYQDCPEGYHVDHIIPLQGENVSGLHVAWNLQYLTPEEKLRKGNKHDIST